MKNSLFVVVNILLSVFIIGGIILIEIYLSYLLHNHIINLFNFQNEYTRFGVFVISLYTVHHAFRSIFEPVLIPKLPETNIRF